MNKDKKEKELLRTYSTSGGKIGAYINICKKQQRTCVNKNIIVQGCRVQRVLEYIFNNREEKMLALYTVNIDFNLYCALFPIHSTHSYTNDMHQ